MLGFEGSTTAEVLAYQQAYIGVKLLGCVEEAGSSWRVGFAVAFLQPWLLPALRSARSTDIHEREQRKVRKAPPKGKVEVLFAQAGMSACLTKVPTKL